MNAPFHPDALGLDRLAVGHASARRVGRLGGARRWRSVPAEAFRLRRGRHGRAAALGPVRPRPDRDSGRPDDGCDPPQARRARSASLPLEPVNPLPLVAVAGSPNAGKSALFNALTGARQKVGNYPGVTVERQSGRLTLGRRPPGRAGRPARRLQPRARQPRRSGHPRRAARPAERRAPARCAGDRPRRLQPRQSPALRAAADRARPADRSSRSTWSISPSATGSSSIRSARA